MQLNSPLNALKKIVASVQRQKEISYYENADTCGDEDGMNSFRLILHGWLP